MKKDLFLLNCFLSLFLLQAVSFSQVVLAQDDFFVDSLIQIDFPVERTTFLKDGYSQETTQINTGAITTISNASFNPGLISDPLLLMQGKLAGVQIYNRGGNPNSNSLIRVRGFSNFSQKKLPLVVIDGIPGVQLSNLDPNDIASISVLKDAASQAIYGMRGANGVVLIQTKGAQFQKDTIAFQYHGQIGIASLAQKDPVLNADEFKAVDGFDLGASTNWIDEITQPGIAHTHTLSANGTTGHTSYRISGTYRSIEGILKNDGFTKYNLRLNLHHRTMNDKLHFKIYSAYSNYTRQLGFTEAFLHASTFNPTAPIAVAPPFPFNIDQFGGYYENLGLFNSFNPLAIVNLNQRKGKEHLLTSTAHIQYEFISQLNLNLRYTYQDDFSNQRSFYAPQALYRGNAYDPIVENRGQAVLKDIDDDFSLYEIYLNLNRKVGSTKMDFTIGSAYHDGHYFQNNLQLNGFNDESQLSIKRIGNLADWTSSATTFDTIRNGWNDRLMSFFGRANLSFNDKVFLDATLRYDGSSKLGQNNKWGFFPAIGVSFDFKEILKTTKLENLNLRLGYGVTGGTPFEGGLSQQQIVLETQQDGTIETREQRIANLNLKWEQKNEFNIGIDFQKDNFLGNIDWYYKTFKDWITLQGEFNENSYTNQHALKATGLEFSLYFIAHKDRNSKLTTGINFSNYQSFFDRDLSTFDLIIGPGGFTQNPLMPQISGEPLGTIYAPSFSGNVDLQGNPFFLDLNGNGIGETAPSQFDPQGDYENIGTGVPSIEIGWNAHYQVNDWELGILFRGALGHLLVNRKRQFQEPIPNTPVFYNLIATELAIQNLSRSTFSSLYVEKADFFKLDNLTIAKTIQIRHGKRAKKMKISLTGQNLFVFSNYSGLDPEPALEDIGTVFLNNQISLGNTTNPLAAGIDRRSSYQPSRTIVLSVQFGF